MNYLRSPYSGRDFLLLRHSWPGRHTASKNCATIRVWPHQRSHVPLYRSYQDLAASGGIEPKDRLPCGERVHFRPILYDLDLLFEQFGQERVFGCQRRIGGHRVPVRPAQSRLRRCVRRQHPELVLKR